MPSQHTVPVVDLTNALGELREYTLIAATFVELASRAMRQRGRAKSARALLRQAARAAEEARERARMLDEATTYARGASRRTSGGLVG